MFSLYRTPPEKRIVGLGEAIDSGHLSPLEEEKVRKAIERQVARLELPDYSLWFFRWAVAGAVIFVSSAFFVGLFGDDLWKLVFYGIYCVYLAISIVFAVWAGISSFRRTRKSKAAPPNKEGKR